MVAPVSDYRSNRNEHILHAVDVLRRSPRRAKVFFAIYRGQKPFKTVTELEAATGLTQIAVLQEGAKLFHEQLIEKKKQGSETAYGKVGVFTVNKDKIARGLNNYSSLEKRLPTKQKPRVSISVQSIRIPRGRRFQASTISCDDIDDFSKVKKVTVGVKRVLSEAAFKCGIAKLLHDTGKFKDWGGEKNDLLSMAHFRGKRKVIAFAFKGPATKGTLTPGKMGKNGDQIQRLFESPAEIFFVQYQGQIAASVLEQLQTHAEIKSFKDNKRIWYGIINGDDSSRLLAAYPKEFSIS